MISIVGLDKAEVLAALYNAAVPLGLGFLHYDKRPMTAQEAKALLNSGTYFDYLKGRPLKVDLRDDSEFDEWLYDRDQGLGKAAKVIESLRTGAKPPEDPTRFAQAASEAEKLSRTATTTSLVGDIPTVTLGCDDLGGPLRDAIAKATKGDTE